MICSRSESCYHQTFSGRSQSPFFTQTGREAEEHSGEGSRGLSQRGFATRAHDTPEHCRLHELVLVQELLMHHHGILRRGGPW